MDRERSHFYRTFILHRRDYSNSSLLLECFSVEHGRFPAIAKGARSKRDGAAAILQPFQPLLIKFVGRGEVKTITGFEHDGMAIQLKGQQLFCGFYLNELLQYLLGRSDPHQKLFYIYHDTLQHLVNQKPIDMVLRYFEIDLLSELGYGLLLDRDAETGKPIDPAALYSFQLERGPIKSTADSSGIRGKTLLALFNRELQLDDRGRQEAREMMRRILQHYLGGRSLKSRELFHISTS